MATSPWHYRYYGRATAKAIHDSGQTPRGWLWQHGVGLPIAGAS